MLYALDCFNPILAASSAISPIAELAHLAESLLQDMTLLLKVGLEFIAILIIAIALVLALNKLLRMSRRPKSLSLQSVRLDLGHALALSLEFLLAADVAGTAVSPSWTAIAKLAAITGIRSFLNFFLQREVQELQQKSQSLSTLNS